MPANAKNQSGRKSAILDSNLIRCGRIIFKAIFWRLRMYECLVTNFLHRDFLVCMLKGGWKIEVDQFDGLFRLAEKLSRELFFQLLRQNFIPFYIHSRSYIWPLHPLAEAGQAAIRIDRRESIKHVRSFRQIFHLNSNLNGALIANARGRLKIHNPYIWTNHRRRPRSHLQFSRSKFKFFTPFVVESSSSHHFRLPWNIWQCGSGSLNRAADRTQHNKELLSYLPLNSFLRVV